jgi:hypothetical protein
MNPLLPPVLFPDEPPLSGDVRLCLFLAFVVHLATIPFLAMVPDGALTIPLAFFLGLSLLWAVPGLLVCLTALYALIAVALLLAAYAFWGARHGEHLLFAAAGVPFLAAVLPMGYAGYRLRALGKTRARTSGASRARKLTSGAWPMAAAFVAMLAAGWGVLASRNGELKRLISFGAARASSRAMSTSCPTPADSPEPDRREFETRRRKDAMRQLAAMRPEEMFANDSEAPASFLGGFNLFQGRRYFGNMTYSWEFEPTLRRYLPFSCRREVLRKLEPTWADSLLRPAETSRLIARGPLGDSLFRSFHCLEFPDSSSIYFARTDRESRTAAWKPIRPGYGLWITRKVSGIETLWPALRVEVFPDSASINSPQAEDSIDPEGIRDLFMVSDSPPGSTPFPYSELAFPREFPMVERDSFEPPDSASAWPRDSTVAFELPGVDTTLVDKVWIEVRIHKFDIDEIEDNPRLEVMLAVLKCRTRQGAELDLAKSERPPKDDQFLGLGISEVVVTDVNGDGDPDFLVKGNYLPERLIITRDGAIQAELPLFPGRGK